MFQGAPQTLKLSQEDRPQKTTRQSTDVLIHLSYHEKDSCSFECLWWNVHGELIQHTWKKSSCFSGLQKNGCLSTQAVEGRSSALALIICSIRSCAMMSADLEEGEFVRPLCILLFAPFRLLEFATLLSIMLAMSENLHISHEDILVIQWTHLDGLSSGWALSKYRFYTFFLST